MASEWRPTTWGEEISLEYGKAIRGYSDVSGKYRVFGSNGPIGWHSEFLATGPGVILGRKGAYRGVKFSKDPFFVIDTAYYVRPKTALDMRWLYYAIIHHRLGEIDDGSPIPSTTRAAVYVRKLNVPPPDEQIAIAAILGSIDDKIETITATNNTLERIARAIFKSWFVDFDPVRAKAEGREPEGMNAATAALFPSQFVTEENRIIPLSWRCLPLRESCKIGSGKRPGERVSAGSENFPVPLYGGAGVMGFVRDSLTEQKTLLTGRVGTLGLVFIATPPFWASDNTLMVQPKKVEDFEFIYFSMHGFALSNLNRGSTQPLLTQTDLGNQSICYPSASIVHRFHEIVSALLNKVERNKGVVDILADLRETLLPRLISGKLRVPEAEKLVEAVL